jgi:hypothetical protein
MLAMNKRRYTAIQTAQVLNNISKRHAIPIHW